MTRKLHEDDWMAPFRAPPVFVSNRRPRPRGRPRKHGVPWPNEWQSKAMQMEALNEAISIARACGFRRTERAYIQFFLTRCEFDTFGARVRAAPRRRPQLAEVAGIQQRLSRWRLTLLTNRGLF